MKNDTLKVFVYGTLKKGGLFASRFDKFRLTNKPGKVKGTMFSVFGNYPGLVLNGETEIKGEVHEYSNAEDVEIALDRIEGFLYSGFTDNLYEKRNVVVETDDGSEECILYEYAQDVSKLTQIQDGEWKL